jgi:hypothetical protein
MQYHGYIDIYICIIYICIIYMYVLYIYMDIMGWFLLLKPYPHCVIIWLWVDDPTQLYVDNQKCQLETTLCYVCALRGLPYGTLTHVGI